MIIKTATVTVDWGAGAVDLSDHVISAAFDSPMSAADDRTFGNPHATDSVTGAQSVTLRCKWSDALMTILDGVIETEGDLVATPVSGGGTLTGTVKFSTIPYPSLAIGERAECDLVLAVTDALDWTAA